MLTYQYNCSHGLLVSTPHYMHKVYPITCVCSQPSSAVGEVGQSPEPGEFVSAVTWRNTTNVLLAAICQGHIKVSVVMMHMYGCTQLYMLHYVSYRYWRCAEVINTRSI